ncbi:MAG: PDZ domain-containing protein [Thermodesulfobacteria bacterium]|nr:PDZ domain-containing protein [Thermodesulfobacteriota bacterium]
MPILWALILIIFFSLPVQAGKDPETIKKIARVRLEASFNTAQNLVRGEARIELPPHKVVWVDVSGLTLKKVTLSGRTIKPALERGRFRILSTSAKQVLRVSFAGRFAGHKNKISKKAIILTGNWFPSVEGLAYYDLHVMVPQNFKAIAPADIIKVKRRKGIATYHFIFNHPQEAPPLIAAPYHYYERRYRGVTLAAYFLKPNERLARAYFATIERYLRYYGKILRPYPYRRFAVVENFRQTGAAYPTFTLIGNRLLALPFIRETSLPHELLHNWFGCGVYPDWEKGNWSEGLVTYLADHHIAEEKGEGALYRHRILVDYQSYVKDGKDFPLKEFRSRFDKRSQAIGYGKGALVFHMLRRRLGDDLFYQALRNFYRKHLFTYASWEDLRRAFEKASGSSLENFFRQWVERPGLPKLSFFRERLLKIGRNKYLVGLSVTQEEPFYELTIPVVVTSEHETKKTLLYLSGTRARIDLEIKGKPVQAILDPEYDLARRLSEPEFPPVLSRLLGAENGYLILWRKRDINIYRPLVSYFEKRHFRLETNHFLPSETRRDLVYLGQVPERIKGLFPQLQGGFCLAVQENPRFPEKVVVWATAQSRGEIERALPKISHLGAYQIVCTSSGRVVLKEKPRFSRGQRIKLTGDIRGTSLENLWPVETVARAVSMQRVIFLGERHDRYEEHLAQLAIIRWLHENGHRIAIGLEMFQRPFQEILDAYISGRMSEEEFLRRSEYFKRWGFDWRFYKPIIDYARKNKIPLVALNIPAEITDKVAKGGVKNLSPEERASVPEIDRSNLAYREYLRQVYESHPEKKREIKDFETFYEAQLLWDEGMAESIVRYLSQHPERQMVVLVGRAHVVYGYGIPSRIARRGIEDYAIVLLSPGESLAPGMADYVLFPAPEKAPFSAKLGVLIEETEEGLTIRKVLPNTPAHKAGLKEGDVIIKADGKEIRSLTDLKLALYAKKPGDKIKLVVLRKGHKKKITVGPFREHTEVR